MQGQKICKSLCENCQYFYGMTGGDFRNNARNSGKSYPMCAYYLDTGKHRLDDFGKERKLNSWMYCNKFTPKTHERDKTLKPMTVSKKGMELASERSLLKGLLNMKFKNIYVCQNCGSINIQTADSRKVDGKLFRVRKCKDCGMKFRTIEVLADDLEKIAKGIEVDENNS